MSNPRKTLLATTIAIGLAILTLPREPHARPGSTAATVAIGAPAPDFALADQDGTLVRLGDLRGRTVVLEWFNPECPFVRYAHRKGTLKGMAERHSGEDVVWLAINSGAPGKQGHGVEKNRRLRKEYGMDYPVLIDESGEVGRTYGARTTPHIYVIDARGILVYRGAVDNAPLGDHEGAKLVNYVEDALTDLAAGRKVRLSETRPYGCSVKYARLEQ